MAKEAQFWANIRDAKIPGDWERIENSLAPGIPDVNYCLGRGIEGWIELKAVVGMPKLLNVTPISIPHFTDVQRRWLRRRWRMGGAAFLFLKVVVPNRNQWFIFDGETAHDHVGLVSAQDHMDLALMHRIGEFPRESIIKVLREGNVGQVNRARGPSTRQSIRGKGQTGI